MWPVNSRSSFAASLIMSGFHLGSQTSSTSTPVAPSTAATFVSTCLTMTSAIGQFGAVSVICTRTAPPWEGRPQASASLPSRGHVTVEGAINGAAVRATLEPDGQGGHWLKVDRKRREAAGAQPGDVRCASSRAAPPRSSASRAGAVYAGQVVGEHNRDNDLPVNVAKDKAFSNVRQSTKEATAVLESPRDLTLEAALEYIESEDLVEITPAAIRLRERLLDERARKRASRVAQ